MPQLSKKYLLIAIILITLLGCNNTKPEAAKTSSSSSANSVNSENKSIAYTGVSISPKSFDANDLSQFFTKADEVGNIVSWQGDWIELGDEKKTPYNMIKLGKQYNFEPLIVTSFFNQSTGILIRPLNEENSKAFEEYSLNYVLKNKPKYIGFGIEVNLLLDKNITAYDTFKNIYRKIYARIKEVSPNTKVFVVLQLERMKGLKGGLFGGVNDPSSHQWKTLTDFDSDVVAFSSYPGLIYKSPNEIPEDYYSEIMKYTNKEVIFTELGWHKGADIKDWESSPEEQADFIAKFAEFTKDLKPKIAIWSFLYDPNAQAPFNSMGLISKDQDTSPAYEGWRNMK